MTKILIKKSLEIMLQEYGIDPCNGLGDDLFLFISSLTPIVNVDLLVYNERGRFLLVKRDDEHCGIGWHVPGGCIRFKETFEERIMAVAKQELGIEKIECDEHPFKVFEIIEHEHRNIENQNERAHFVTLVFKCKVGSDYIIDNKDLSESDAGYIKWFDKLPDDLLRIQDCYRNIMQ